MQNKKVVLISIICILALFFVGGYVFKNKQSEEASSKVKENYSALVREHSFVVGNKDAKVELVEFFDPACETCAIFHPHVKKIMKENNGNVKLVLRYAPFHSGSYDVVKMLEATKEQNKFVETLELVFVTQKYWVVNHVADLNALWSILSKAGVLDMNKLVEDMKNPKLDEIIKQDIADGKTVGASKTPSYFVNGKPLQVFGLNQLKQLINSEL